MMGFSAMTDTATRPLRFHWSMSAAGQGDRAAQARAAVTGVPDLEVLTAFCRHAEECGIESLLTAFGFHRPDPLTLAAALAMRTSRIKFMVAVRSGVCSPTLFVQQVNTVAALSGGRICINVVAGHTPEEQRGYGDFLEHDDRYARTDEFLTVCRSFWRREPLIHFEGSHYRIENGKLNLPFLDGERSAPEIFLGGNSSEAERLAVKHADCWWRLPDRPDVLATKWRALAGSGTEIGLLMSICVRPTREEAVRDAYALVAGFGERPRAAHRHFREKSDSVAFRSTYDLADRFDWLTPYMWTGAVATMGAPAVALVGSPEDVAEGILDLKRAGVSQFLFIGWPDLEQMTTFHRDVLPLVRELERRDERDQREGETA
jgi:alkanesulfonate monooxygenase